LRFARGWFRSYVVAGGTDEIGGADRSRAPTTPVIAAADHLDANCGPADGNPVASIGAANQLGHGRGESIGGTDRRAAR